MKMTDELAKLIDDYNALSDKEKTAFADYVCGDASTSELYEQLKYRNAA